MAGGIKQLSIHETPVAVIDFETTGLTPGSDRVIEVSVVRLDPGKAPRLAFDTLINPNQRVTATEIHGITDQDVAGAPQFQEIAGDLLAALEGCVVAAYNVYFDIKFLNYEMAIAGINHIPPHFCLMYMRPLLGLGSRCRLEEACRQHRIDYANAHVAAQDALVSCQLLQKYNEEMLSQNIVTYGDLAGLAKYKYLKSFSKEPYPGREKYGLAKCDRRKSRTGGVQEVEVDPTRNALRQYWETLTAVISDLEITDQELAYIVAERKRLGLAAEHIRYLHARVFASAIAQFCADQWLDVDETAKLRRLRHCLSTLGWAPGD